MYQKTLLTDKILPNTIKNRFYEKVLVPNENGCMLWIGSKDMCGYPCLSIRGRNIRVHRYSYQLHYGEIPEGMQVLHRCDTPFCVAPDHLWLGTHNDNMADKKKKNRCNIPKMLNAKLTKEEAKIIKMAKNFGYNRKWLAYIYNISPSAVERIWNGTFYNEVETNE